jgi:homoserine kinase type II
LGIKTKLTLNEVNSLIKESNIEFSFIKQTISGISDSTYIGVSKDDGKYIFKLFENSSVEDVNNELSLLESLNHLQVPKVVSKNISFYKNKPSALFSYIEGNSLSDIKFEQLSQIVVFLFELHNSTNKIYKTKNIYSKNYLVHMIDSIEEKSLKNSIKERFILVEDLDMRSDSIIHGDLFPDNAKFVNGKLSGVYDFANSCYGNRYFDLAVVLISWCFKEYKFNLDHFYKALEIYDKNLKSKEIKNYLLYACLYYSLQRYIRKDKKSYKEFLIKFDILKEIL